METKICTSCKLTKRIDLFRLRKRGSKLRQSACIDCSNKYAKNHYRQNKKYYANKNKRLRDSNFNLIRSSKMGKSCIKCGESRWWVLDYHHTGDDKLTEVASMSSFGKDRIIEEINKCILLCSNCHRDLHYFA